MKLEKLFCKAKSSQNFLNLLVQVKVSNFQISYLAIFQS